MIDAINAEITAGLPISLHVAYAFQILKNCDIKEKDNCPIYAQLRLLVMQQHKDDQKIEYVESYPYRRFPRRNRKKFIS